MQPHDRDVMTGAKIPAGWIPKLEDKRHYCHQCKTEIVFEVKLQRADGCPHCGTDLHCCHNCEYWDPSAHNQCREHIAEYIPDREKANYCSFFVFRNGPAEDTGAKVTVAKAKLDALFKK